MFVRTLSSERDQTQSLLQQTITGAHAMCESPHVNRKYYINNIQYKNFSKIELRRWQGKCWKMSGAAFAYINAFRPPRPQTFQENVQNSLCDLQQI